MEHEYVCIVQPREGEGEREGGRGGEGNEDGRNTNAVDRNPGMVLTFRTRDASN